MNGDFDKYESSATAYAWFIWEKGFRELMGYGKVYRRRYRYINTHKLKTIK